MCQQNQLMQSIWLTLTLVNLVLAGRARDPLFIYEFPRAQCLQGYCSDTANLLSPAVFGHLHINTSTTTCPGLGVETDDQRPASLRVLSALNSSHFLQKLNSTTGWTFEAWLQLDDFNSCPLCEYRQVVSIGKIDEDPSNQIYGPNLRFRHQREGENNTFSVQLRIEAYGLSTDLIAGNVDVPLHKPLHIVFRITWAPSEVEPGTIDWYINGATSNNSEKFPYTNEIISTWEEEHYLQILSDKFLPAQDNLYAPPGGSIYLLAMYDRLLNISEIEQNFQSSLTNSPPIANDIVVFVNEDGEMDNTKREFGTTIFGVNSSPIDLVVTDADDDEDYPTFDPHSTPTSPLVFITSLPSKGTLLDTTGNVIITTPYPVPYDANRKNSNGSGFTVEYCPVKDEFSGASPYSSFTYSAIDSKTNETSVAPGTVTIHVISINDPPVAENISETVIAGVEKILYINGTDVDKQHGDMVQGAIVNHSPEHGVLYQVYSNGSRSSVVASSGDALWGKLVSYVYTGNLSYTQNFNQAEWNDVIGEDTFTFRVIDTNDELSIAPGSAILLILSGITALPPESLGNPSWQCTEDEDQSIFMFAQYRPSQVSRDLEFVISGTPHHGVLYSNSNEMVSVGDKLDATKDGDYNRASVIYHPQRNYFNSPQSHFNENTKENLLKFYAQEKSNSDQHSREAIQYLKVVNVNDATLITCPSDIYEVQAIGMSTLNSANEVEFKDRVYLTGFVINDPDGGSDLVGVTMTTKYGLLSLNPNHLDKLDFNSVSVCLESDWVCHGSGSSDQRLQFAGFPQHVERALNGMTYQTHISGVTDTIVLTIHDDYNAVNCDQEMLASTDHPTCWRESCNITVATTPYIFENYVDTTGSNKVTDILPLQVWGSIIAGWIIVTLATTYNTFVRRS